MADDRQEVNGPKATVAADANLSATVLVGLAIGVLIIGQANPEPRVTYLEIPLNTLLFIFAAATFASNKVPQSVKHVVCLASLPVLLIVIATLWSPDIESGLTKSGNLYLCSLIAAGLLAAACADAGVRRVLLVLLIVLASLLVFAILVKVRYGFFDRTVPFGMNGPIVFARFMGVAAVIAIFVLTGALRVIAVLLFLLAVAWTQSKGPFLSTLAVLALISMIEGHGFRRLLGPAIIVGFLALLVALAALVTDAPMIDRFALAVSFSDPGQSTANYGSIGLRLETYLASIDLIEEKPLGVGTGGWAIATGQYYMEYPHNFLLEVLSEMGLILGPIAILPYLAFLISPIREFRYLALLLALAQQTSGDLLDSRMWLAFSLASISVRPASMLELLRRRSPA